MKNIYFEKEINGKKLAFTINNLAEQANASVFAQLGETVVLATVTMSNQEIQGQDFFPLTVEFLERYYAAGKILGSRFIRREGRPSEESILTARLIDRAIRPLFPDHLRREVQVIVTCLSWDEENDPDLPGLLATSLALSISDIPWNGPIGGIRIAKKDNKFIVAPSYQEREESELDIIVTGVEENKEILINMIETEALEENETEILKAIQRAEIIIKELIEFQKEITQKCGRKKEVIPEPEKQKEIRKVIEEKFGKKLKENLIAKPSIENKKKNRQLEEEILDFVKDNFGEEKIGYARTVIKDILKEALTKLVLEKKIRPDGRKLDEIRPIEADVGLLPRTHGSGLFIRGATKALSIVTLGSPSDQRLIEGMEFRGKKRFMHHYNFPPYCSGEIKPLRGPGRREIGHGMLGEKALRPLIPDFEKFPYTIRVVTEILSSNGSTSMASVSSSSLALMDAGVPIKRPAAGIAIGIVQKDEKYKLLTDIQGPEDHFGGMDFKVAGTEKGVTAIQLDVKIKGVRLKVIEEVLQRAKKARLEILEKTNQVLNKPREKLSPFAPKILSLKIDPEKVGQVIGPGGKTINSIIEKYEVSIDIEPEGHIYITSPSEEANKKAAEWIKNLTRELKVGEVFQGKVTKILDFGAIVELFPERDGLLHISKISNKRIRRVEDVLKVGDIIPVKIIELDDLGRPRLALVKEKHPFSNSKK